MTGKELAAAISDGVRIRRLERIGENPPHSPGAPFEELPQEDQQTWLDIAEAIQDCDLTIGRATVKLEARSPWVVVEVPDGAIAIWKSTGAVFREDVHGAVEDEPIKLPAPSDLITETDGRAHGEPLGTPTCAHGTIAGQECERCRAERAG